ncbi:SPOR domain-containing protein [Hyphomonas sp.]|uniref:SPOR domain-containing protein n=1 Tax=Hyphomonas sp. TaxID=87 RepID=UPI0035298921
MSRYRYGADEASPFEDDYRGFDIRDDETARGPLILALAIGVLLVFGAVVWNTYRQGVRSNGAGLPSVIADAQPYKRVPDERGGLEVRDTDKRFYDQMDASERVPDLANLDNGDGSDLLQGGPPIDLRPNDDDMDGSDPDNGMPNSVADEVAELADLSRPDRRIESEPLAPMSVTRAPPPPPRDMSPQFAFSEGGLYLVQVAAFRTEDAAEAAWRKSAAAHPDLYRGAGKHIQRADLGAKGVFYRLRVGGFSQKTEADAFCDALKAQGDNCIVVTG